MTHLTRELYGTDTEKERLSDTVDVGTTDTTVVPQNGDRVLLVLVNTGGATVWVNPNGAASTNVGLPLSAGDGIVSFNKVEDGDLVNREMRAVAESGTQTLTRTAEVARRPVEVP